jgi:hypothetical protein
MKYNENKNEPNKALEPTSILVTISAAQKVAPSIPAAQLDRSAKNITE